jgi:hypothetical protein
MSMRLRIMLVTCAVLALSSSRLQATSWFQNGIYWAAGPDGSQVNDCPGNCGAGCGSFANPCGGRAQYWELEVVVGPNQIAGPQTWVGCEGSSELFLETFNTYEAIGRWTYHGHAATGCEAHDAICGPETIPLCVFFAGCGEEYDWDWSYEQYMIGHELLAFTYLGSYPGNCHGFWPSLAL